MLTGHDFNPHDTAHAAVLISHDNSSNSAKKARRLNTVLARRFLQSFTLDIQI